MNLKIAFFGTPQFATLVLDELKKADMLPSLIVTQPDKPADRGLELRESAVKKWALAHGVPVSQPEDLKGFQAADFDIFIVAAYGKIIPRSVLDLSKYRTLNVHPSLLPRYRGPSPIEQQILDDTKEVGVSVILLDDEMDHGPIVAQKSIPLSEPMGRKNLENLLWREGGKLLAETIIRYIEKKIAPVPQDDAQATFTPKLKKEDGLLDLSGDARRNYLKYLAYEGWPGTYFFATRDGKEMRVKIIEAEYKNGIFTPTRVIPEGKKEISYADFVRNSI